MPNSDLINKYFTPPDKVLNKIESALGKVDLNKKDIKGFRRGKEILKNKRISYAQMKKIKIVGIDRINKPKKYILLFLAKSTPAAVKPEREIKIGIFI